jgi:ABC-type transporter Mla MlaB component
MFRQSEARRKRITSTESEPGKNHHMFRITTDTDAGSIALKLDGKLTEPWTDELDRYWREAGDFQGKAVCVDLTGVTFIDADGKALLVRMYREGATFHVSGCLNSSIVEEILEQGRSDAFGRPASNNHDADRK